MSNQETVTRQRARYMAGELTHQAYYEWLGNFIGATFAMLPVCDNRVRESKDPHFNDIPLGLWGHRDHIIRPLAYAKGLAWALSDTVCVLKAIAARVADRVPS